MKKLIIVIFLGLSLYGYSQNKEFDNDSIIKAYIVNSNDIIKINIETAYLMNTPTFNLYNKAYELFRNNLFCDSLYIPIIQSKDNRIEVLEDSYDDLYDQYIELHNKSNTLIETFQDNNDTLTSVIVKQNKINNKLKKSNKLLTKITIGTSGLSLLLLLIILI